MLGSPNSIKDFYSTSIKTHLDVAIITFYKYLATIAITRVKGLGVYWGGSGKVRGEVGRRQNVYSVSPRTAHGFYFLIL